MRLFRTIKLWLALLLIAALALGVWRVHDQHRHRILVLLPDGSNAPSPSVTLDYDPIYEYHPTTIDGKDGTVYIPRARAYGQGWETMKISDSTGEKRYYARRYPTQCSYPMTVVLEELPPAPPPPSTLQQAAEIFNAFKRVIRESRP